MYLATDKREIELILRRQEKKKSTGHPVSDMYFICEVWALGMDAKVAQAFCPLPLFPGFRLTLYFQLETEKILTNECPGICY